MNAVAQTVKAEAGSVTRETGEELLGHRMLADEVTGLYACSSTPASEIAETAVRPKRDMDANEVNDNVNDNDADRPKCDMVAEGQSVNEIEEDAVRPKFAWMRKRRPARRSNDAVRPECDMDAEEMTDNEINIDAVRPKSDLDAEDFDEDAKKKQARKKEWSSSSKNILEVNEEVSLEDVEIRRLIEERKNCQGRETTLERIEQTDKKMHQTQEKNKKTRKYSKNT